MIEEKSTYNITDPLIGRFVQPIAAGDLAESFESRDQDGRLLSSTDDHLSGRHLLLLFLNNPAREVAVETLKAFSKEAHNLESKGATVVGIHSNSNAAVNSRLKHESGFQWPILGDPSGVIFAKYGLHKNHGNTVRMVLLTPYRQIRCWYDNPAALKATLETIMNQIATPTLQENAAWYPLHAPVLLIPKVFTREECQALVAVFLENTDLHVASSQSATANTDFKVPVYEHNRQDRIDHIIRNKNTIDLIDQKIARRVNPMIKKAFAFDVTRRELLHIARYVGERGGNQMGHRDNTSTEAAHRRFAFSMNLNDDYEGGGIVFNEFNSHAYRAEPGTVLTFSSSLLHEVQQTVGGVRYSLITHLSNDATIQNLLRSDINKRQSTTKESFPRA